MKLIKIYIAIVLTLLLSSATNVFAYSSDGGPDNSVTVLTVKHEAHFEHEAVKSDIGLQHRSFEEMKSENTVLKLKPKLISVNLFSRAEVIQRE